MRAIWYTDSGETFDEKSAMEIEKKHIELFNESTYKQQQQQQPSDVTDPASKENAFVSYDATTDELDINTSHYKQAKAQQAAAAAAAAAVAAGDKMERERECFYEKNWE